MTIEQHAAAIAQAVFVHSAAEDKQAVLARRLVEFAKAIQQERSI